MGIDHQFKNLFTVIIQVFQSTLNKLFGYHTFYIFLINIICWYIGLYCLLISFIYDIEDLKKFIKELRGKNK